MKCKNTINVKLLLLSSMSSMSSMSSSILSLLNVKVCELGMVISEGDICKSDRAVMENLIVELKNLCNKNVSKRKRGASV